MRKLSEGKQEGNSGDQSSVVKPTSSIGIAGIKARGPLLSIILLHRHITDKIAYHQITQSTITLLSHLFRSIVPQFQQR